jgi:hypothetical protein
MKNVLSKHTMSKAKPVKMRLAGYKSKIDKIKKARIPHNGGIRVLAIRHGVSVNFLLTKFIVKLHRF